METIHHSRHFHCSGSLVYMCLPVWREWKPHRTSERHSINFCIHVPSRLEGMETCVSFSENYIVYKNIFVYMCLPVWRESKLPDPEDAGPLCRRSLHVPSRLEGIETRRESTNKILSVLVYMCLPVWRELKQTVLAAAEVVIKPSTCAFPFGGNRNDAQGDGCVPQRVHEVYMCLPVWRELKLIVIRDFVSQLT